MFEPAIVVIAYNRVKPLQRLLGSLSKANYPSDNITLHISIDGSNDSIVKKIADGFEWEHGEKVIDLKPENLGLVKHVVECGQLTKKYGTIIVLEDDLIVAPGFYQYAQQASEFYSKEDNIAGVSLFTYPVEENNFYPFQPINDGSDVHFIQVASSWGQSWTESQWAKFTTWLTENPGGKDNLLPNYVTQWGNRSWKKLFISYMIDTNRFFVFPNTSYTSNFEDEGTNATSMELFQVPMRIGNTCPRFNSFSDSRSIYDPYFELRPECVKSLIPALSNVDFDVDIYGEKPLEVGAKYVLTTKRCSKSIKSFGSEMKPLIQNVIYEIGGGDVVLCRKEDLELTEDLRFLSLNTSSTQLNQYEKTKKQKFEQVSIVVPVLNDQVELFSKTIKNLAKDRFYNATLMIACSVEIAGSVKELLNDISANVTFMISESQDASNLLREGIENCTTDYCGWIQPGMQIDLLRMESVAHMFRRIAQVQVVMGIQAEVHRDNYLRLNTAEQRWTPARVNSNKSKAGKIRTELVFWRRSLVPEEVVARLKCESLFLELLMLNPVYVLALKLGDFKDVPQVKSLSVQEVSKMFSEKELQPKGVIGAVFRPIFQFWFSRNVPFFRLFYKEAERLPLVIRYDFENDSFYLDNY